MEMAGFGVEVGAMQRLHEESVRRRAQVRGPIGTRA